MIALVTDALATHRLARMVTEDVLTEPIRDALIRAAYVAAGRAEDEERRQPDQTWTERVGYDDAPPRVAYLLTCNHCSGLWLAIGVVLARRFAPRAWDPIARALAIGAVPSILADFQ